MTAADNDAETIFVREMNLALLPTWVEGVPDELFHPGMENRLLQRIEQIVELRIVRDKIPLPQHLRARLTESILTDIAKVQQERFGTQN